VKEENGEEGEGSFLGGFLMGEFGWGGEKKLLKKKVCGSAVILYQALA